MRQRSEVEFVITSPESLGPHVPFTVRARTTLGSISTVIASSQMRLVLSAPFIQANEALSAEPLATAIALALDRNVRVEIASTLMGIESVKHSTILMSHEKQLRLFVSQPNLEFSNKLGSHAKFCVNDQKVAYLGSANFTKPGLSEHLEMGVLVRGQPAIQILEFWEFLLDREFFVEYRL